LETPMVEKTLFAVVYTAAVVVLLLDTFVWVRA
jgi:hypothetical protein